jgi:hypothetical protein
MARRKGRRSFGSMRQLPSDRRVPKPPSSASHSGRSATRASSLKDPRSVRPTAAVRCAEVRSASRPAGHSESGWSDDVSADVERTPDSTSSSQNLPHVFGSQPPRSPATKEPKSVVGRIRRSRPRPPRNRRGRGYPPASPLYQHPRSAVVRAASSRERSSRRRRRCRMGGRSCCR